MNHSPAFLKLAESARKSIREISADEVLAKLQSSEPFHFVDVREESEWALGHLPSAIHLSKGIIERDIEVRIPKKDEEIVLYCGGGYRSALAARNLKEMGYTNVLSMAGGYREWVDAKRPLTLNK